MRSRKLQLLAAIAAGGMLVGPGSASAWVAVGGPGLFGAAAVGVAAGAVAGAAVASSRPTTVVVPPPAAPSPPAAVGTVVTTLPSGCVAADGRYQCGSVWYQPYFGGSGVYYQVIPPP